VRIDLIDTPLLNQHSYKVSCKRFMETGFEFRGNLQRGIGETLGALGALGRQDASVAGGVEF
jgi:hypothetical protein